MPTLFLRLTSPAHHDEDGYRLQAEWCIVEADGSTRAKGETDYRGLSDLIDPSADWLQDPGNVVVLVPTANVLALTCEVPGRSSGQIRRALPFVVEEFVATDIESLHLASGPVKRGEPVSVNLVDRVLLEDWLACLQSLKVRPGYLIAESELLPLEEGGASVLLEEDTAVIRTPGQSASVDRENLLLALSNVSAGDLLVLNGELSQLERGQLDATLSLQTRETGADSALGVLIELWRQTPAAINLLQGPYTAQRPQSKSIGRWRAVATLAGFWVLVGVVGLIVEGFWSDMQASELESRSEELYRQIYPGEERIINVRRQMSQKLGQRIDGVGRGFTEYVGFLAQGVDRNASILSLNYTENRDELAADLLLRNYDELERMKQRLSQLGVTVEITSAEQQDSGVRARIRLKGA